MLEKHRLKESDYLVKAQDPPDLIAPRTPLLLLLLLLLSRFSRVQLCATP